MGIFKQELSQDIVFYVYFCHLYLPTDLPKLKQQQQSAWLSSECQTDLVGFWQQQQYHYYTKYWKKEIQ